MLAVDKTDTLDYVLKLTAEVKRLLQKAPDNDLLWVFRTQLRRMGEGTWATMPSDLQRHVLERVKAAVADEKAIRNHIIMCLKYDRTWAAAPLARAFVFRSAFAALWEAGQGALNYSDFYHA